MSNANAVTALIRQIAGDEELRNRLLAANETDRARIIADLGFTGITQADIAAGASAVASQMAAQFDESELESLAGGGGATTGRRGGTPDAAYSGATSAAVAV